MRLITYKSVRRRLARVGGGGSPPVVPADLLADGKTAGVLTSAVVDGDGWIGLAVVPNDVADSKRALEVAGAGAIGSLEPLELTRPRGRP